MSEKALYVYEGSVLLFNEVIKHKWRAQTWATSAKKAASNLAYRFKMSSGMAADCYVHLAGEPKRV